MTRVKEPFWNISGEIGNTRCATAVYIYGTDSEVKIIFMDDGLRPVRYDSALALRQLAVADAKLGALIERVGPFALQVKSTHSPFEALLEASVPATARECSPRHSWTPAGVVWGCTSAAGTIAGDTGGETACRRPLAGKLLSLRDLAAKTLDGTVPTIGAIRRLPDGEIVERLSHVRGIGTWTAEMLLIFRLGRPDVFPARIMEFARDIF